MSWARDVARLPLRSGGHGAVCLYAWGRYALTRAGGTASPDGMHKFYTAPVRKLESVCFVLEYEDVRGLEIVVNSGYPAPGPCIVPSASARAYTCWRSQFSRATVSLTDLVYVSRHMMRARDVLKGD
jgi:hypothetical protein